MKEVIVIKSASYSFSNMYVINATKEDVELDQAENAKHFPSKQHAEDYLEIFPFLERDDDVLVNAYTLETLYIIEK
jgi:hypothetical protein